MSVEQFLHDYLVADAGVSAIQGSRLYLVQIPQNPTFPCTAYQRISTQRIWTQDISGSNGTFGYCRFQFTCFADQTASGGKTAIALSSAIVAALQKFNMAAPVGSPVVLRQAPNFVLNQRMDIEPQQQIPLFRMILDVKLWCLTEV